MPNRIIDCYVVEIMENKIKDIELYLEEINGLPVSLAWKGYGSMVFLELGQLEKIQANGQIHENGEVCISVSWDWRFEQGTSVLFGSSNSSPEIDDGIKVFKDKIIEYVKTVGEVQELEVGFSDSTILRTMIMLNDNPEWSIRIKNGQYIYPKQGTLYLGEGGSELTEVEKIEFDLAEKTTKRWGIPFVEPKVGDCSLCAYYRRIDGEANFLDYGVCISNGGTFDGRVVHVDSGCPSFVVSKEI